MAIDIPLELDSGPITWVKAEVDSALFRALAGIDKLRSSPSAELRNAVRADLHQVSGAFELVGVEGLAVLVQEFEKHFAADVDIVPLEALDLVDKGCRRLLSHLKEMVSGSPPVPLRFISEYLALGKLRRSKYGPADLFFPDLSRRPAKLASADPPEPSRMPAFLLRQRRDFQQGLLQWLRGNNSGLDQMRRAVAEIEAAYPLPSQRSFWWATHALLEAANTGMLESSTALKQLMARVDLQVRRFVEGSTRVADRLRREVLYHVARAQTGNQLVDDVKALYELEVLVPKRIPREIDVVSLQPAISALTAIIARCKDSWTSLSSGRSNALPRLREAAAELPAACDALNMADFSNLGRGIANAANSVAEGKSVTDDLSIEFATSLILIETALEHIAALPTSFRTQVDRSVQRLSYATSNAPIPPELRSETEANSLTRLAQEKQTVSQVAREIRANMRLVEQALDAVFRDRTAIDELKPLPALLGQVSGAMRMLGWNDANELLTKTSDRLIDAVRREQSLSAQEIDSLADVLAGLSFYVDVRERRDQDADAILAGLTRRFLGEGESEPVDSDHSVEASLAERQRSLRPLARALTDEPDRPELLETLRSTLQGVRQDAELLSDPGLSQASNEALRLLDSGSAESAALSAAVAAVVGGTAVLPPTSLETSRLVKSGQEDRDSGLLDIFVEEAVEVVAAVRAQHAELSVHHDRRDLLIDTRRAFHTLKGSGRMVGQTELAEVAWRVEGVLNAAIEAERPVNEAELKLVGSAVEHFSGWIETLRAGNPLGLDVSVLDRLVENCVPRSSSVVHNVGNVPVESTPVAAAAVIVSEVAAAAPVDDSELDALLATAVKSLEAPGHAEIMAELPALVVDIPPVVEEEPPELFPTTDYPSAFDAHADDIHVLGVSVSRALFSILTDETRVHLQTLDYELTLMQFDPELQPSDAMVRASHTLCGIHRTAGFIEIGDFAGLLESALMAARRSGRGASALSVFGLAIQSLRTATLRLQAQSPMSPEEHGDIELSRLQLHSMIADSGNTGLGVEIELLEQTHAEERALTQSDAPAPISPATTSLLDAFSGVAPLQTTPLQVTTPPAAVVTAEPALVAAETPVPTSAPALLVTAPAADALISPSQLAADVQPVAEPAAVVAERGIEASSGDAPPAPSTVQPQSDGQVPVAVPALAGLGATVAAIAASALAAPAPAVAPTVPPVLTVPPLPRAISTLVTTSPGPTVTPGFENRGGALAAEVRPATRSAEDPLTDVRDDIDEQVLPIFLEEAQELFPTASEQMNAWRNDVRNPAHSDGLKRTLHTLKGSARMAGAMRLGELAHGLETQLLEGSDVPSPASFDTFDEYLDDIAYVLERLTRGEKDVVLPRFVAVAQPPEDVFAAEPAPLEPGPDFETLPVGGALEAAAMVPTSAAATRSVADIARGLATRAAPLPATLAVEPSATAMLRVRSDAVEQLADEAGEISIHRSRIEAEMRNLKAGLLDLTSSVVRLRGQLREIEIQGESQIQSRLDQESEFDPLEFDRYTRFQELTRGLAEGVNDVATVQQSLLKNLADADIALSTQTRLSRSVQLRLQTLRTVPFSNLSDRLYRVLRQTAKELKKRANLDIRGGRIEIDRSVLERLTPVIEHLVRNSLAHGIETDESRARLGKPGIGELTLAARQQGNEVAISLSDDGDGIPLDKVRARAVALGLIGADESMSDGQLLEFIFQPGFSTADQVTAVAGRGVGMDVVRSEVTALGGRVEVHTERGVGTTFTLSVPLTLAVTQVLLVGVGKSIFGVPSSIIEQVRQIPAKERQAAALSGQLDHGGNKIEFRSLGALVRIAHDTDAQRTTPVIVLRAGDAIAAVQVDRIISNQEVVAKPYGPQLARVPGLAGLTVLADGTITLLLNPLNLILSQEVDVVRRNVSAISVAAAALPESIANVPVAATGVPAGAAPAEPVTPPEVAPVTLAVELPMPAAPAEPMAPVATVPDVVGEAPAVVVPTVDPVIELPPPVAAPAPVADFVVTPPPVVAPPELTVVPPLRPVYMPPPVFEAPTEVEAHVPVVLVVDDSLTVRKITTRLLEREGYKALTAKDGLDALQILSDANPDVILLDIEMPRMDGFEFTKTIKADNRQNNIPIIMITSRTAEKHRNHAMELGVNEYLGKPYQDEQLLALIVKYAGKPG